MKGYLGEFDVDIKETPFRIFDKAAWAMYYISLFGGIDGEHHKTWLLDQLARILLGTPVIVKEARWANGTKEYRFEIGRISIDYRLWKQAKESD